MDLLMNGLLLAATCFAGSYCWVLARRVRDLKSLDSGLGGAIVTLTRQVELARTTLEEARSSSRDTKLELSKLVQEADTAANRLRLLLAAAPHPAPARPAAEPPVAERPTSPADARRDAPAAARDPEPAAPPLRLARRPKAVAAPAVAPEEAPAAAILSEAPIQIPTLDRLVAGPLARPRAPEAAEPARPAPHLAEVPKPRALAPIENPLRRLRAASTKPVPAKPAPAEMPGAAAPGDSEDALLEALSALAGGR